MSVESRRDVPAGCSYFLHAYISGHNAYTSILAVISVFRTCGAGTRCKLGEDGVQVLSR